MHRRWVGSLLSLLLPGAGIFLAGDRKSGLRWFVGLTMLGFAADTLDSATLIPSVHAYWSTTLLFWALVVVVLVLSFRPIPRLRARGWIGFILLSAILNLAFWSASRQITHPFKVPAGSMEPTIQREDHLLVQKYAYWFSEPKRGDIVVFRTDDIESPLLPKGTFYIKRVAALPGEELQIVDGQLRVNGKTIETPTVLAGSSFAILPFNSREPQTNFVTVVPKEAYFVVGDNGTNSFDSRYYGSVPRRSIIGKATKIYWPYERAGDLR